jgi:hypothetical protein
MPDAGERFDCHPLVSSEEAHMLQSSNASQAVEGRAMANVTSAMPSVMPTAMHDAIAECVGIVARALGCAGVWTRTTGPYILLGERNGDAFARLTSLGGTSYGLAFRAVADKRTQPAAWEPILLIDDLSAAIEHALIGIGVASSTA